MTENKLKTWLESHPRALSLAFSTVTFIFAATTTAVATNGGGSTIGGL
ncbi:hypothetical protein ACFQJC_07395 [Haloferax namakaokahaiae]|uniref:Uncharacterized protein n=1 Tax=Haloferax namakaokahaiae TaxID=1748331 RepID=A0ABD5ZDW1_9EURY